MLLVSSLCLFQIDPTYLPSDVVATVVDHECRQRSLSNSMTSNLVHKAPDQFVLKVCGKEEYLLRECCIHMYKVGRIFIFLIHLSLTESPTLSFG